MKQENLPAAEGLSVLCDLLLNFVNSGYSGDQKAGCKGCNRHHYRVGQKVEEIQKLHPDDLYIGKRAIA